MAEPNVRIDPPAVSGVADRLRVLADAVRSALDAAAADTARTDGPAGFGATTAAATAWATWSRQLDVTATESAVLADEVRASAAAWRQTDALVAGAMAGGN